MACSSLLLVGAIILSMKLCEGFIARSSPVPRHVADYDRIRTEHTVLMTQGPTATDGVVDPELQCISRKDLLSSLLAGAAASQLLVLSALPASAEDQATKSIAPSSPSHRILPCNKSVSGAPANCVSTASVKQVDLYMAPWTWPEGTSAEEVVGRIKGIVDTDGTLQMVEQHDNRYFRLRAARNFNYDEIELVVNPLDRVITFRSQQVEGPESVSDFGANRKRLEDIRKRIPFLQVMGAEFDSADSGPREGVGGQLKAFWGLQSGGGFEKVLLDEDDDY